MQSTVKFFPHGSTVLMAGATLLFARSSLNPLGVNKCRQSLYVIIYVITYLRTLGSVTGPIVNVKILVQLVSVLHIQIMHYLSTADYFYITCVSDRC
jgi:hypothetical protein